jgi:hypothetical protein
MSHHAIMFERVTNTLKLIGLQPSLTCPCGVGTVLSDGLGCIGFRVNRQRWTVFMGKWPTARTRRMEVLEWIIIVVITITITISLLSSFPVIKR